MMILPTYLRLLMVSFLSFFFFLTSAQAQIDLRAAFDNAQGYATDMDGSWKLESAVEYDDSKHAIPVPTDELDVYIIDSGQQDGRIFLAMNTAQGVNSTRTYLRLTTFNYLTKEFIWKDSKWQCRLLGDKTHIVCNETKKDASVTYYYLTLVSKTIEPKERALLKPADEQVKPNIQQVAPFAPPAKPGTQSEFRKLENNKTTVTKPVSPPVTQANTTPPIATPKKTPRPPTPAELERQRVEQERLDRERAAKAAYDKIIQKKHFDISQAYDKLITKLAAGKPLRISYKLPEAPKKLRLRILLCDQGWISERAGCKTFEEKTNDGSALKSEHTLDEILNSGKAYVILALEVFENEAWTVEEQTGLSRTEFISKLLSVTHGIRYSLSYYEIKPKKVESNELYDDSYDANEFAPPFSVRNESRYFPHRRIPVETVVASKPIVFNIDVFTNPATSPIQPNELRNRLIQSPVDDFDIMATMSQFKEVDDALSEDSCANNYRLREHQFRIFMLLPEVKRCWITDELISNYRKKGIELQALLSVVMVLHDIGKPKSCLEGRKDQQHAYTLPILSRTMQLLGYNQAEINLARALVDNDLIGDYMKGSVKLTPTLRGLRRIADRLQLSLVDFFQLQTAYFIADAGSYPAIQVHVMGLNENSCIEPLHQLYEGWGWGSAKPNDGAFKILSNAVHGIIVPEKEEPEPAPAPEKPSENEKPPAPKFIPDPSDKYDPAFGL